MPKHIPALTSATVMNLRPPAGQSRVEVSDGKVGGLRLRVHANGEKVWSLVAPGPDGKRLRVVVGKGLGLAEARNKAMELKVAILRGEMPLAAPAPSEGAPSGPAPAPAPQMTLRNVLDAYAVAEGCDRKSWDASRGTLNNVFKGLLDAPALSLDESHFLIAIDSYPARGQAASASRYVRPVIKWASKRKLMQKGVHAEIETKQTNVRTRVLDDDELKRVLQALGGSGYDRCARFILWTLARRAETEQAVWGDVNLDLGTWVIRGEQRKNVKRKGEMPSLVIPLPKQAIACLRSVGPGQPGELIFKNERGGVLGNWDKWQHAINERSNTSGWHRHDLRRTSATFAGKKLGVPPHVIEMMLGHKHAHSALASVYNTSRYEPEHQEALQKIADAYERIERDETNVVGLHQRAQ